MMSHGGVRSDQVEVRTEHVANHVAADIPSSKGLSMGKGNASVGGKDGNFNGSFSLKTPSTPSRIDCCQMFHSPISMSHVLEKVASMRYSLYTDLTSDA